MKHYSKRARLKAKKVNAQPKVEELARGPQAERPTEERKRHGVWTEPKGMGKNEVPVTDMASDMIGLLHWSGKITTSQEQAARVFQEARWAYLAELPEISDYKSCIANDVAGYDDSDGDAAVIARYRAIERKVGKNGVSELIWVVQASQKPRSLAVLKAALTLIGEM